MATDQDRRLGAVIVRSNLATREEVDTCLALQAKQRQAGIKTDSLGEILIIQGILTAKQLDQILEDQIQDLEIQRIGPYEVVARIGEGGMGDVYKARDVDTGGMVALKVLNPWFLGKAGFLPRFLREAKRGMEMDHPNVVKTLLFGEEGGNHYIALELVEGGDLKERLARKGRLEEREALEIIRCVASALQHAHELGLVHRDVKPGNIMFTLDGTVKLSDFGLVKPLVTDTTSMTIVGRTLGTPQYLSPEQALGMKDIDARTDFYALGATFYHLVTGRPPFEGTSAIELVRKRLKETALAPDDLAPTLGSGCVALIEKMLARDRVDRYATAAEIVEDVERVLRGEEPARAVVEEKKSSVKVSSKRRERTKTESRPIDDPEPAEWEAIFDGSDLEGWTNPDGLSRVEAGAAIMKGNAEIHRPIPAADFELAGSVRLIDGPVMVVGALAFRRPSDERVEPFVVFCNDGDVRLWDGGKGVAQAGSGAVSLTEWSPFTLRVAGEQVSMELGGHPLLQGRVSRLKAGNLAFYGYQNEGKACTLGIRALRWRPIR